MISRKEILKFLIDRTGEWVSNENLSKAFQIDGITLLKHIDDLQNEGYHIESISSLVLFKSALTFAISTFGLNGFVI